MSADIKKEIQLEIAHVLFIDIVGYSKLSINEQRAAVDELTAVVRSSDQYQKAEAAARLIKIPTGDGMALVFYKSPEEPAQCALEVSRALKEHPSIQLRMGAHSGPVSKLVDVNNRPNIAGAGINIAQRVMDCGDAGHILLSRRVADDLGEDEHWRPLLHDLGECEVKHGARIHIVNLYTEELGNPDLPGKFKRATPALAPQRPTIREKSAAEILANLKEIALPSQFCKKVEELYVGRWTREPGWQVTVFSLPSKLSGGGWQCSLKEVGSDILVMASTTQDVSKLRPGDSVTVSGRISEVWQALPVGLEDAILQGENVPSPESRGLPR
jgi:class 3 adenylate cyclase